MFQDHLAAPEGEHVLTATISLVDSRGTRTVRAEWRGLIVTKDGQRSLDWRERPEDERPLRIRLMPDFGSAYAWNEYGVCIGLDYLFPHIPEAAELEKEIEAWQATFERAELVFEPRQMIVGLDWDAFHTEGMALARRLKSLVGDEAVVFYERPYEDPNREEDEIRVVPPSPLGEGGGEGEMAKVELGVIGTRKEAAMT